MKISELRLTGEEWLALTARKLWEHDGDDDHYPTLLVTEMREYQLTCVWDGVEHRDSSGERVFRAIPGPARS
jgi:hypothetical protein